MHNRDDKSRVNTTVTFDPEIKVVQKYIPGNLCEIAW